MYLKIFNSTTSSGGLFSAKGYNKKPLKILDFQGLKWRRLRDSNPRAQRANGFQEVYQRIPFQLSSVQFSLKQFLKILILQGFFGLFGTDMN